MLLQANRAINQLQRHIQSMMKVSAPYGKKMGAMGTAPWQSAHGSTFANKTAQMMAQRPEASGAMLDSIMKKASTAGMSEPHMARMQEVADRIRSQVDQGIPSGRARKMRDVPRDFASNG